MVPRPIKIFSGTLHLVRKPARRCIESGTTKNILDFTEIGIYCELRDKLDEVFRYQIEDSIKLKLWKL